MAIVERVRRINKKAHIVVRVKHIENVEEFYKLGADQVFPEKFEIAIDLFNRFLANKLLPQKEINRIITRIRNLSLGEFSGKDSINQPSIIDELPNMNIRITSYNVCYTKLLRNASTVTPVFVRNWISEIE